jgi:hypothetical protein
MRFRPREHWPTWDIRCLTSGLVRGRPGVRRCFGAVEFFGHQSAIPGENGIGFGEARDLLQSFAS